MLGLHMAWADQLSRPGRGLAQFYYSALTRVATAARIKGWQMKVGAGRPGSVVDGWTMDRRIGSLAGLLACSPRWSLVSERVGGSRARKTHQLISGTGFSRERVTCLGCRHVASAQRQPRERLTCSQYALSGARWCRLEQIPGGRSLVRSPSSWFGRFLALAQDFRVLAWHNRATWCGHKLHYC